MLFCSGVGYGFGAKCGRFAGDSHCVLLTFWKLLASCRLRAGNPSLLKTSSGWSHLMLSTIEAWTFVHSSGQLTCIFHPKPPEHTKINPSRLER